MTIAPRRYALVGCGRSKLDRAAPARELYTGPLFRAALETAETEFGADVWILSAKYGLTDPHETLEPYDLRLDDLPPKERADWARDVIRNLVDNDDGTPAHLTVYAGSTYVGELRAHLPTQWTLDDPMKGLGQGERLAWLKARLAEHSATPTAADLAVPPPSAGPRASPVELRMSNAIPTTLTHEQRSEAFTQALALEDGLRELESLKARILAGLEVKAETMRQDHARLMRAATTGANPEAPEQHQLPLKEAAPAAPMQPTTTAPPTGDEPLPPEPPKGKSRNRSRKAAPVEQGAKRTEASSARTASAAQASASQAPEVDDAVPAPRVPCCECGDSVADHEGGTGRCLRVRGTRKCKCKRFVAVAVDLPGAPGWKVRPVEARLSTGEGGERGHVLVASAVESLPLHWVPGYGLAFQDGEAVSAVYSYLGEGVTTLEYEKDPRWKRVPRAVLRALAEYLGATWPAKPEEAAASDEFRTDAIPDLDDPFTTPPTDGEVAPEFHGLDLTALHAVLGKPRAEHRTYTVDVEGSSPRACEACGTRERPRGFVRFNYEDRKNKRSAVVGGGGFAMALCLEHCTVEGVKRAESNRTRRVERERLARMQAEESEAASPEATSVTETLPRVEATPDHPCECDGCGETFKASELQPVGDGEGKGFYCPKCKAKVDDFEAGKEEEPLSTSAPAGLPSESTAPPQDLFGRPWPAIDEARFPGWFVDVCPGFAGKGDSISAGRLHDLHLFVNLKGPEAQSIRSLRWFPADVAVVRIGPDTEPGDFGIGALPPGLYAALVDHLSTNWPIPEEIRRAADKAVSAPPPKTKKSRERKAKAPQPPDSVAKQCGNLNEKMGLRCVDPAGHDGGWHHGPSEPSGGARRWKNDAYQYVGPNVGPGKATEASTPIAWRVELPERNEHTIIRLWLVNDATGERKPATWWSGVSSLRRSHHLSGTLDGEQLAAHVELESWWRENADTIVRPLAEACREGRVPGLKVYEPETLGAGPHIYALSNGRSLEAWEGEGEEAKPHVDFVSPTERSDMQLRVGPFVLSPEGHLTTANTEAAEWSAENESVVAEAESFIARGFIFELRPEGAA